MFEFASWNIKYKIFCLLSFNFKSSIFETKDGIEIKGFHFYPLKEQILKIYISMRAKRGEREWNKYERKKMEYEME